MLPPSSEGELFKNGQEGDFLLAFLGLPRGGGEGRGVLWGFAKRARTQNGGGFFSSKRKRGSEHERSRVGL